VQAIRPPSVPAGTARLRLTGSARHSAADITSALGAIGDVLRSLRQGCWAPVSTRAPLLVVAGTRTSIGKTYVAVALVRAWGRSRRVCAFKPIESGGDADGRALAAAVASTFHVKRPAPCVPKEPSVAAPRQARRRASHKPAGRAERRRCPAVRGGCSGTGARGGSLRADRPAPIERRSRIGTAPTRVVLVAPDRLGVLHDVGACTRAAAATGLAIDGIILNSPEVPGCFDGNKRGGTT
jgi:dethiobiotin synthetase